MSNINLQHKIHQQH